MRVIHENAIKLWYWVPVVPLDSAFLKHFEAMLTAAWQWACRAKKARIAVCNLNWKTKTAWRYCASMLRNPEGPYGACEFKWIIDATGALTIDDQGPEKRLDALNAKQLLRQFEVNAVGPALLMKHFFPFAFTQEMACYATLSARVGSIEDNYKGGWYGYRAAKAARNMLLQTAAIEAVRKRPLSVFLPHCNQAPFNLICLLSLFLDKTAITTRRISLEVDAMFCLN
jgi:hypothetical protein